jgi:hypothetical protein
MGLAAAASLRSDQGLLPTFESASGRTHFVRLGVRSPLIWRNWEMMTSNLAFELALSVSALAGFLVTFTW